MFLQWNLQYIYLKFEFLFYYLFIKFELLGTFSLVVLLGLHKSSGKLLCATHSLENIWIVRRLKPGKVELPLSQSFMPSIRQNCLFYSYLGT